LTSSIPLIDSMATLPVNVSRFEYGQVRRWGSVGFIVASTLGGIYLHGRHTESILTLLTVAAALMLMAAILLPNQRSLPRQSHRSATMDLLANKRFVILLITAAMLQSSHAGLYGFATIHWLDAEISERTVGLLWAEGVLAEVLFFSQGRRILKWFPIHRILLIAAIAGLVRWSVLGMTTNLAFLIMVQTLHALTFAGTHLATVSYISKNIDSSHSATAQGLYSGLAMGLVFGLAMILAGKAYMTHEGYVFLVMLIFSVLGGVGAMSLWKMDSKC
ncbi:MAG: MFS transporter, partial [Gammaproteobacteria bacterium]|nr:MFS transporter [Gammaproteobacteria bacterium]